MNTEDLLRKNIIADMSEGVMTVVLNGTISHVNRAAEVILGIKAEMLVGKSFARCFMEHAENDAFNQCILDAIYDASCSHKNIVPYYSNGTTRHLHITTSYIHDNGQRIGVIAVLSDITELNELRDAVKAMERIKALNVQLELRNQLLSETFGRFLSDEIVRQLLDTPDGLALGGKKRTLTVMMSDLRGFTAMSERMEAGDLLTMLNHYLGEMTEEIQKYNGTIIEFIGDGIMAIFGAPAPSENHAADAIAAAVQMQNRMKEINRWNAERGYPVLEMGIGLNTGEVIVGNIGSEKRTKYGVVGSQVNLCGRIESYTVGGQILISPLTREMAGTDLEIAQEMEVFPKGVKGALVLSHVTGIGEPFNFSCAEEDDVFQPLKKQQDVEFVLIQEKHVEKQTENGCFVAVSENGAIMQTDYPLKEHDNIRLEAGGDLFAKVIKAVPQGWMLRFTAVSPDYKRWLEQTI